VQRVAWREERRCGAEVARHEEHGPDRELLSSLRSIWPRTADDLVPLRLQRPRRRSTWAWEKATADNLVFRRLQRQ
jgi:hypothetical protein